MQLVAAEAVAPTAQAALTPSTSRDELVGRVGAAAALDGRRGGSRPGHATVGREQVADALAAPTARCPRRGRPSRCRRARRGRSAPSSAGSRSSDSCGEHVEVEAYVAATGRAATGRARSRRPGARAPAGRPRPGPCRSRCRGCGRCGATSASARRASPSTSLACRDHAGRRSRRSRGCPAPASSQRVGRVRQRAAACWAARSLRRRRQYSSPQRPRPKPARQVHSHQVRPLSCERAPEGEEAEEAEQPQRRADLGGAYAVDVERRDLRHDEGAVADLVLRRLLVTQVHGGHATAPRRGETRTSHRSATLPFRERRHHDCQAAHQRLRARRVLRDQRARLDRRTGGPRRRRHVPDDGLHHRAEPAHPRLRARLDRRLPRRRRRARERHPRDRCRHGARRRRPHHRDGRLRQLPAGAGDGPRPQRVRRQLDRAPVHVGRTRWASSSSRASSSWCWC